ncbi:unnamed protein product [Symbiodinium natans]|uniref:Uncharacterized protein n=1 Tax=Symbiodinium natans TaxID=878477 RepID=A0A812KTR7_9DINO|nr:unnamed protein product [Symbiodinium natans]
MATGLLLAFVDRDAATVEAAAATLAILQPRVAVRVLRGDMVAVALGQELGEEVGGGSGASSASATAAAPPSALARHVDSDAFRDVPTFIMYGANTAGLASGNLQKAISEAFPEQFADIAQQMCQAPPHDGFGHGEVFVSHESRNIRLLAVSLFPRPSEGPAAVRRGAADALRTAQALAGPSFRVVSHALGSFTGHPRPQDFAECLAGAVEDWLSDRDS